MIDLENSECVKAAMLRLADLMEKRAKMVRMGPATYHREALALIEAAELIRNNDWYDGEKIW